MAVISKLIQNGKDITKLSNSTLSEINIEKDIGVLSKGTYHFAKSNEVVGVESATCENAVEEPILDMKLSGNSYQKTYSDENLLDMSRIEYGTFNTNTGEPIESTYTAQCRTAYFVELINGNQITHMCSTNIRIWVWDLNENFISTHIISPNTPFTISINCKVKFSSSSSGFDGSQQIKLTYVAPTPEKPIEIESVGEKTKNLLNCDHREYSTIGGITVTYNDDGSITYKGTATIPLSLYLTKTHFTLEAGTYTINSVSERCRTYLIPGYLTGTFTLKEPTNFTATYVNVPNGETLDKTFYPQLEKGNISTKYEPYGKYKIPIKVRGKNLINIPDGSEVSLGIETFDITKECPKRVPIVLSANLRRTEVGTNARVRIRYVEDGTNKYLFGTPITTEGFSYVTGTIPLNATSVAITMQKLDNDLGQLYWSNVQLEKGETVTEYEPYVEPISTNVYLNEPLKKIGNYVDYIDYKNKKIVRQVGKLLLTGKEYWKSSTLLEDGTMRYWVNATEGYITNGVSDTSKCTHFIVEPYANRGAINQINKIFVGASDATSPNLGIQIRILATLADNVSTLNEFLANAYNSENPVKIEYALMKPSEETIDIPQLETFKGTNIFEAETNIKPSEVKVKYWKQI